MPSKLPVIKANTSNENITKMKTIAKYNKRSVAKELEFIIEKHIDEFEKEHGEINVEESETMEQVKDYVKMVTDEKVPVKERAKKAFMVGFNAGAGKNNE